MLATTIKKPVATAGEIRWLKNAQIRFLINPEDTGGDFAIVELTSLAGLEPPPHIHQNEDETFLLQEGEMRFFVGEQVIDAKPGMVVFAPRGIRHSFKILTPAARFHLLVSPGDFANYFREVSTETPLDGPIEPPPPAQLSIYTQYLERHYNIRFLHDSL